MEMFGGGRQPSEAVRLPHDAMLGGSARPGWPLGNGLLPRRHLGVREVVRRARDDCAVERVLLEFEGVYRSASVRVNGALVGHRPYGYSDFTVSIGEHLRVRRGERRRGRRRPSHDDARWYSGAGIYRNVHLVVGDPVHLALDGVHVTTPAGRRRRRDGRGGHASWRTSRWPRRRTTVTTEIVDDAGDGRRPRRRPTHRVPGPLRDAAATPLRRAAPSVERRPPALYTCRTVPRLRRKASSTAASTTFGIRTIEVDPERGLRINGEPVELRGACIHHDNGVLGAATIPRADERRVEKLQGGRLQRAAQRAPPHEPGRCSTSCDRLGMLVMDETFDMWTEPKTDDDYAQAFPDWWPADVDAMVHKDRNHPSRDHVLHRQRDPRDRPPSGAALGRAIAERIRALDATRLVTNSINPLLAVRYRAVRVSSARGHRRTPMPSREHWHQHDDDDDGAVPADHPPARGRRRAHRRVVRLPRRRAATTTPSRATRWITSCTRSA